MPPWIAFSHSALRWRKTSAGLIVPRSRTPIKVPIRVPRPPETAAPPTTAAAITCISSPVPVLGSTTGNCTTLSNA